MLHIDHLLEQSCANKDHTDQVDWLIQVFKWLRFPRDVENFKIADHRVYSVRIKYLLLLLSRNPDWKNNFVTSFSSILQRMSSVNLFTDAGMSYNTSFVQEFIQRLEEKIIPQSPLTDNLSSLLYEIFSNDEESYLIDCIDEDIFSAFLDLFENDQTLKKNLVHHILTSLYVLTTQLLSNGIALQREFEGTLDQIQQWPETHLHEIMTQTKNESLQNVLPKIQSCLDECESRQQKYYSQIQEKGIKVDSVYILESQKRRIDRIKILLNILDLEKPKAKSLRLFVSTLVLGVQHQKSLRSFFVENMSLLTQRIVQRNSDVGEHYITNTWAEFRKMYFSAAGGGALTSLTVFLKFAISSLGATGFIKGFIESLNYSTSFVFIQNFGLTLATKQPSATAPYLAQSLKHSLSESKKAVIAILRTQFIAVIGNLSLVFPICFLISWSLFYFDHALMTSTEAVIVISSTNVLGPSPLFAVFTGFLLFLSSLIAGWFDNWMTVHNIPQHIENHQGLIKSIGKIKTRKLSLLLKNSSNPYAASISLGFLLGLAPQFIKFMGIPLEARHITLSTGQFAAALPLIFNQLTTYDYINSVLGLLVIGIFNISVSFGLALVLAAISSQVKISHLWQLLKWGLRLVLIKPWLLLIPEKSDLEKI
jgi:site-specific recombinase